MARFFFVTAAWGLRSLVGERRNHAPQNYKNMKQTLTVIAAIALGAFSFAQAQPSGGPHGGRHMNPLEEMSSSLNLTDAQKAKVQPIVDQAKPQLQAIHQEAMTKAKAVIDASITQIRPLLTPEQQKKLDESQNDRRGGRGGRGGHHRGQGGQDESDEG